jgi:hypothetical protein
MSFGSWIFFLAFSSECYQDNCHRGWISALYAVDGDQTKGPQTRCRVVEEKSGWRRGPIADSAGSNDLGSLAEPPFPRSPPFHKDHLIHSTGWTLHPHGTLTR